MRFLSWNVSAFSRYENLQLYWTPIIIFFFRILKMVTTVYRTTLEQLKYIEGKNLEITSKF